MSLVCGVLPIVFLCQLVLGTVGGSSASEPVSDDLILLYVHHDEITPGNYTYMYLEDAGRLVLQIDSHRGDADLYVSDSTRHPSFDDYELQSTTCGPDWVVVPPRFRRPVAVGVYGHPSHPETEYEIKVYLDRGVIEDPFAELSYPTDKGTGDGTPGKTVQEEKSVMWTIMIGILKLVLEILF
ncbi:UPF0669 protein C6orf120 homolog [Stegostoma tigrinum]|uniref:UPF0669 protein C6orf120 homolog n=1 Tax=Stegostoma tigrinum TaxID=3053191 RepID=UPI0028701C70|nr:UPF0669 protein C6orf120 homolog [Stegostoma tigrinum]